MHIRKRYYNVADTSFTNFTQYNISRSGKYSGASYRMTVVKRHFDLSDLSMTRSLLVDFREFLRCILNIGRLHLAAHRSYYCTVMLCTQTEIQSDH